MLIKLITCKTFFLFSLHNKDQQQNCNTVVTVGRKSKIEEKNAFY